MIPINKRKIGVCILLSIVTFGIYQIYWEYLLVKNTRAIQKDKSNCTGEMLCLVFVPFYSLFWWFTRGKTVKDKFAEHGYSAIGNEIAYLILGIFGLTIVSMAIMQNDFNSLKSESTQSIQRSARILMLTETAILMGVVIVLQLFAGSITIGNVSFSLVLVPIVLGGILAGPYAGAILGLTFGAITLIGGITGTDPFTAVLMNEQPVITALLCILKAVLAGLGSALLYKLLVRKNKLLAVFVASASAPIINTGIFILGALLMSNTIEANFSSAMGVSVIYFVVIICAGVNFLVELGVNILFAPALYRVSLIPRLTGQSNK